MNLNHVLGLKLHTEVNKCSFIINQCDFPGICLLFANVHIHLSSKLHYVIKVLRYNYVVRLDNYSPFNYFSPRLKVLMSSEALAQRVSQALSD